MNRSAALHTNPAWLSRSRRLADSNCCNIRLAPERWSRKGTSTDFVTRRQGVLVTAGGDIQRDYACSTASVTTAGAALSPFLEVRSASARPHRGVAHRAGAARPRCPLEHRLADLAGSPSLPLPSRLAARGVLRSSARVCRLASRLARLGGCAVTVRRRDAVPPGDVGERRRPPGTVAVVSARAALPGVREVAC